MKHSCTSSAVSPALASALSVTKWPMEPRLVATLRPLRSAAILSGESGRTSTAVP